MGKYDAITQGMTQASSILAQALRQRNEQAYAQQLAQQKYQQSLALQRNRADTEWDLYQKQKDYDADQKSAAEFAQRRRQTQVANMLFPPEQEYPYDPDIGMTEGPFYQRPEFTSAEQAYASLDPNDPEYQRNLQRLALVLSATGEPEVAGAIKTIYGLPGVGADNRKKAAEADTTERVEAAMAEAARRTGVDPEAREHYEAMLVGSGLADNIQKELLTAAMEKDPGERSRRLEAISKFMDPQDAARWITVGPDRLFGLAEPYKELASGGPMTPGRASSLQSIGETLRQMRGEEAAAGGGPAGHAGSGGAAGAPGPRATGVAPTVAVDPSYNMPDYSMPPEALQQLAALGLMPEGPGAPLPGPGGGAPPPASPQAAALEALVGGRVPGASARARSTLDPSFLLRGGQTDAGAHMEERSRGWRRLGETAAPLGKSLAQGAAAGGLGALGLAAAPLNLARYGQMRPPEGGVFRAAEAQMRAALETAGGIPAGDDPSAQRDDFLRGLGLGGPKGAPPSPGGNPLVEQLEQPAEGPLLVNKDQMGALLQGQGSLGDRGYVPEGGGVTGGGNPEWAQGFDWLGQTTKGKAMAPKPSGGFSRLMKATKRLEGGLSTDSRDRGGLTKYGISQKAHPDVDIRNLTWEQAQDIYKRDYYEPIQGDALESIDPRVLDGIFDFTINSGQRTAIKAVQRVLGIKEDGFVGNQTLKELRGYIDEFGVEDFMESLKYRRLSHMKSILGPGGWDDYEENWTRRLNEVYG